MSDGRRTMSNDSAEKRLATFVKCDIVDSTRWSNELDLEDQRAMSHAFRDAVSRVVAEESGHIMRFEGDAVLLSFGHPDAREDAAESAVRAGLALVLEIGAIEPRPGVNLRVRVGVGSGEVAIGDVIAGGDRVEHAVDGPVPSMAERLRAVGEPGQVVVSDLTRRLCGAFFDYVDLGTVTAKGFDHGLHAWLVRGTTSVSSTFEARHSGRDEDAIVGRDEAVAEITTAWRHAVAGRGRPMALVGEAGMGKSRLAHAVQSMAADDGATFLRIDCTPRTRNSPFFPIGVLLRRLAGIGAATPASDKERLAAKLLEGALGPVAGHAALPYLAPLLGLKEMALPPGLMPNEVRDQTVAINVQLLREIAARGPMLVLCEDLHWADATTLAVLEQAASQIEHLRCMLLVTTRSVTDVPLNWSLFHRIDLQALNDADSIRLVRSVSHTVDEEVAQQIVARSAGVPLYIVEIASEMGEAARFGTAPSVTMVPTSLKLVVQSRLGRWPALKQIVQVASVLDREFSIELLERMMKARGPEVVPTIALLGQHGFFRQARAASSRVEFKHAVIRDAVYDTLLRMDKSRWHSAAADELTQHFSGTPDASADALAYHLVESQRFTEAVRIRFAAATETAARGAFVEAVGHCDAALLWTDRLADDAESAMLRVSLLVQRAVALSAQHGFGAEIVEEAYELAAERLEDRIPALLRYPISRGRAAVRLIRGDLARAHDFAGEGMAIAELSGLPAHRLDALSMRLYTTLYAGTLTECRRVVDEFLLLYEAEDGDRLQYPAPHNAKTAVLSLLPTIVWLLGDDRGAEEAIRQGLAHVEKVQRPYDQAMMHAWIAGTRYTQRRFAESAQHAITAIGIAAPRGYSDWSNTGGLLALLAQATLQPTPELIAQARGACALLDAGRVGLNASWHRWAIAQACEAMGDFATAQHLLDEGRERARASNETRLDAELLLLEARLPHNVDRASRLLVAAQEAASGVGDITTALRATAVWVLNHGEDADSERAGMARSALDRLAGASAADRESGWMSEALSQLTARAVRREERSV